MSLAIAIPAAMAGVSVFQGLVGNAAARRNARAVRAWGAYNSAMARRYSAFNANAIEELAKVNSFLIEATAETNIKIKEALTQYNAALRVQVAEQNAALLEKEAALVWEAQELDQTLFRRQAELLQKDSRAKFASSGVDMNSGSPVDYMVDQSTQIELESFIIRHNADIQIGKILDAAALGRWQGEAEASAIMFEGALENLTTGTQSKMQMMQLNAQAAYDAIMTRFSGDVRATQILSDSTWKAAQYESEGTMALISGIFQGASWAAMGYEWNSILNERAGVTATETSVSNVIR